MDNSKNRSYRSLQRGLIHFGAQFQKEPLIATPTRTSAPFSFQLHNLISVPWTLSEGFTWDKTILKGFVYERYVNTRTTIPCAVLGPYMGRTDHFLAISREILRFKRRNFVTSSFMANGSLPQSFSCCSRSKPQRQHLEGRPVFPNPKYV